MAAIVSKLLSAVVALGYLVAIAVARGEVGNGLVYAIVYLIFPLALIRFPEFFGSLTGYVGAVVLSMLNRHPFSSSSSVGYSY